ncbi:transposase [Erysipelothrix anatis]|uniref:transposase n=1 Tax=Erysipelothrix anatis TaxID=2683713 RepID=UPI00135A4CD5|nr:transposase [Erysipelothrix anatis]
MLNKRMRYNEVFKKSIVALCHDGQTQLRLCEDYGIASSTIHKWIKLHSEVEADKGEILTTKQVRELQ